MHAAWAGCAAAELLGQEARYHTSAEVTGPAGAAAALSPPPEVWTGRTTKSTVTLPGADGAGVSRHVEFIPLSAGGTEVAGVIGVASPALLPATDDLDPDTDHAELSSTDLHDRLARWRRQLAGRFHIDRLLGPSPAMRQLRNQVELAAAAQPACRSSARRAAAGSTSLVRFTTAAPPRRPDHSSPWLVRS